MPRRFYVSSRKDRSEQANALSEALKAHGWERTFVWTDQSGAGSGARAATAEAELKGVRDADILVVLLPGGFGTHVEIGAALALGKKVLLHSPDQETLENPYPCVFHYHPRVTLVVSETLDVSQVVALMED
jgi:nucleoside 2-deoxyribosyltransferase